MIFSRVLVTIGLLMFLPSATSGVDVINAQTHQSWWKRFWNRRPWFDHQSTAGNNNKNSTATMTQRSIHWFRKGLRIHDNPALLASLADCDEFWPVFVLDPWFVKNARVGANRWRFLLQSLQDLDESFKKFNTRLFVAKGKPEEVFRKLFKDWRITRLTFEVDTEPYAIKRDAEIIKLAEKHGIQVVQKVSHTLYDIERTITKNGGRPPLTYQRMQNLVSQMGVPAKPVETLTDEHFKNCTMPTGNGVDDEFKVPTLEELGVNSAKLGPNLYPGGETEAMSRLRKHLERKAWICNFEKPKTEPNSLEPSTTVLSPYLKFGCLSVKTMYHGLLDVLKQVKKHSQPPVSLVGQLLWREFFYTVGAGTANFDRMQGNSVCRQIPWDNNTQLFEAWKNARTGYPFIDAIMTQLRKEGWIHHLARHSVACFLTRGDLWVSWEKGQEVFEELLLDADWSLNAGNWMWLSASAFFHQYFRVYSPVAFGKKTDKSGSYIKKYLPILKKYPEQYIYEPWKAPRSVQERAGCVIGIDYPNRIVDHDVIHKENIKKMAAAYAAAKESSSNGKSTAQSGATTPKRKSASNSAAKSKKQKTDIANYFDKK
ncbi:cryptochrome-2-like [Tubulanus polymorphus]|uniref:cryptochrome-2-like n=1 Tax=Tubulanus polymorphus TaxID=672921 RepID=UPI003DA49C1C